MTGNATLNIVLYLLGLCGFGGIIAGIVVKSFNRRMDKSDARRDELDKARLEADIIVNEGLCAVGGLARATAIAVRDGKTNGETKHALENYEVWSTRRAAFIERQAAEWRRGEA